MAVRGKCYLIFQLSITIILDLSVDNNNSPYRQSADKVIEKADCLGRLYGLLHFPTWSKIHIPVASGLGGVTQLVRLGVWHLGWHSESMY